jgi:hypothetical protein
MFSVNKREVLIYMWSILQSGRPCGLVVPGYRSRGPGSILGATKFFFFKSSGFGIVSSRPGEYN